MYFGDPEGVGRVPCEESSLSGKAAGVVTVLMGHQGKVGRASEKLANVARARRVLCMGAIVDDDVNCLERWRRQLVPLIDYASSVGFSNWQVLIE